MERRSAVKRRATLLAAALALLAAAAPARADESVALIVSATSPIARLDSLEVRKLFLGFSVIRDGRNLRALRNSSSGRIRQIFLQNVVAMSESTYERRLLSVALQLGQTRPAEFSSGAQLLEAVAKDPAAVSYVFSSEVAGNPRIKVLRLLWHD
jgi:hypothetical protein